MLMQAFVFLIAGLIAVPVARRLGLGSVLGYLLAGVLVGPFVLNQLGNPEEVRHIAELGVVMMLFLIGLEMRVSLLWQLRVQIMGMGSAQVLGTSAVIFALCWAVGVAWEPAVAIGLMLALSSTAIVLQTLDEKGWRATPGGRSAFAVLLLQDIAVIPMLALLPLLADPADLAELEAGAAAQQAETAPAPAASATPAAPAPAAAPPADATAGDVPALPLLPEPDPAAGADAADHDGAQAEAHGDAHGGAHAEAMAPSLLDQLPEWAQPLAVLGAVLAVVIIGRFLLRPAFRFIAETRMRELFTVAALAVVVGVALLMASVGMSPALGAFLAGLVLAESEFRHQLETDIEPFRALLLGLFFISVGAGIDFSLLASEPLPILALVVVLIGIKFGLLLAIARGFRLLWQDALLFSLALAQGGEFGFVLIGTATQTDVMTDGLAAVLTVAIALSMAAAPLLFIAFERLVMPRFQSLGAPPLPADTIDDDAPDAIVAGFGRFGQVIGRLLLVNGFRTVVLDHSAGQVDLLRGFGVKVYYGDAARMDLLRMAGAERAKLLVIAVDDRNTVREIAEQAREAFPHLRILARAFDRRDAYELLNLGVEAVERETFESALRGGVQALRLLGFRAHRAERAGLLFRRHDLRLLEEMRHHWGLDATTFRRLARERNQLTEKLIRDDLARAPGVDGEAGWGRDGKEADPERTGTAEAGRAA